MTTTEHQLRGVDLAVEVIAYNDLYPENWDQSSWFNLLDEEGYALNPKVASPADPGWKEEVFRPFGETDPDYAFLPLGTLETILGHPCKTAGCLAGNAVFLAGWTPLFKLESANGVIEWDDDAQARDPQGGLHAIPVAARQLLELPQESVYACRGDCPADDECDCEPVALFDGTNRREDLVLGLATVYGLSVDQFEDRVRSRVITMAHEEQARAARRERPPG